MGVMLLLMNKSLDSFKKQVNERLNQFDDRLCTVETGMARIEGALFHREAARREIDR